MTGKIDVVTIGLWIAVLLTPVASLYAGISFIFYAWLEASGQWPTDKAAVWAYSSLFISVLLIVAFVYCLLRLRARLKNRKARREASASE